MVVEEIREDEDEQDEVDLREIDRPPRRCYRIRYRDGHRFVDLSDLGVDWDWGPYRRLVFLLLLLGVKDYASEIRLEPPAGEGEAEQKPRLTYVVLGERYELVPPPAMAAPPMIDELKRLAGLLSWRCRLGRLVRGLARRLDGQPLGAQTGAFQIRGGDESCTVEVRIEPPPNGETFVISITSISPALSAAAQQCMRALFDARQERSARTRGIARENGALAREDEAPAEPG